jgi:hypothetical protein
MTQIQWSRWGVVVVKSCRAASAEVLELSMFSDTRFVSTINNKQHEAIKWRPQRSRE